MQSTYMPYQELANAIVYQAVTDYRNALKGISYIESLTPEVCIKRLEKFFHSSYYRTLTKVNGDYLIEQLRKEHEERSKNESIIDSSNT